MVLFSADGEDIPDALAGLAASAALAVSDIPFNGPISEVRVARVDGQYIVNPTFTQLEKADIDIMVGATLDNIMPWLNAAFRLYGINDIMNQIASNGWYWPYVITLVIAA